MARKTAEVTIDAEGRDKGKVFVLTEMSATAAEEWGARALLAMMHSGVEVPENIATIGIAGIAVLGLNALSSVRWEEAKPLFDQMFECIKIKPDRSKEFTRALIEDDIEDVSTRLFLRKQIMMLHIGHFMNAARSGADQAQAAL